MYRRDSLKSDRKSRDYRRGQPGKRRAIVDGAQTVFARDGYSRASIDAISAEAGVSTRTVYNHFTDKKALFQAVIQESAQRAADAQIAVIDRHLSKVTDLESDLVAFCCAFAAPLGPASSAHFALVRQVSAEAEHIPREVLDAWQEAGPLRVRRALGRRLQRLGRRGLLRVEDPSLAALHLMMLTALPSPSAPPGAVVSRGVLAFLHGYGP